MAPVVTIEDALFDQATAELHEALSELAEASKGPLTVRRRVPERRAVLVDINDAHLRPINRFHIEYAKETAGNRDADGVNAAERRRPTTVTAYAGNPWTAATADASMANWVFTPLDDRSYARADIQPTLPIEMPRIGSWREGEKIHRFVGGQSRQK